MIAAARAYEAAGLRSFRRNPHGGLQFTRKNEIISLLESFGLPCSTSETASTLLGAALSDKKRAGSTVNLIIPRKIGHCDICPTPVTELESVIKAGL